MSNVRTYTPQINSVAWRVIEFFTTNPEEELTLSDLETKFEKSASQFYSLLGASVEAGVLKRSTNSDEELVYSLGDGHASVAPNKARNPSLRSDALLAGAVVKKRKAALAIDLNAVPLRSDVPLPSAKGKQLDWPKLFKRMEVGQSCELPKAVRAALHKACTKAKADGLGEFALRSGSDETVALWRVA